LIHCVDADEQPDLRQCNRKDTNDDMEKYDSAEEKAEEWVFRNLAKGKSPRQSWFRVWGFGSG
jgi:hypothetical protein